MSFRREQDRKPAPHATARGRARGRRQWAAKPRRALARSTIARVAGERQITSVAPSASPLPPRRLIRDRATICPNSGISRLFQTPAPERLDNALRMAAALARVLDEVEVLVGSDLLDADKHGAAPYSRHQHHDTLHPCKQNPRFLLKYSERFSTTTWRARLYP
jgi:hypothetical protein